jgi:hypothetical protein
VKDPRPLISERLRRVHSWDFVWLNWPGTRLRLKIRRPDPPPVDGEHVIIVHKGKFGLGCYVEKDGMKVFDVAFHDGTQRSQLYVRWRDIRAVVIEAHGKDKTEADRMTIVPALTLLERMLVKAGDTKAVHVPPFPGTCSTCEHHAQGRCYHPSNDGPCKVDPASLPSWCPGYSPR